MADEIEFINKRGEKTYLPESVGDSMGLQRVSDFVPPESIVQPPVLHGIGTSAIKQTAEQEQQHAITTLYGIAANGVDSVSAEVADSLRNLTDRLLEFGFGPEPVEGHNEKTGAPSLVEAIAAVEVQIDADNSKTPAQKKTLKKHLQELLDAAPGDSTPPADTPPAE